MLWEHVLTGHSLKALSHEKSLATIHSIGNKCMTAGVPNDYYNGRPEHRISPHCSEEEFEWSGGLILTTVMQ